MPTYIVTSHAAKNDANGNPRRVYVFRELHIYDPGDRAHRDYYGVDGYTHIVFTHDEGYGSLRNAMEQFRKRGYVGDVVANGGVECSISNYKRLVKRSAEGGA